MTTDVRVLYSTFPNADEAEKVAGVLLEENLIACANLLGDVRSVYRWEGNVNSDPETIMIAKTTAAQLDRAITVLCREHSYECPCVTSWPVTAGAPDYLAWVMSETKSG